GELAFDHSQPEVSGLSFAKWGMAGCAQRINWRAEVLHKRQQLRKRAGNCQMVAVAYADWRRARAPSPLEICRFAGSHACNTFLLDTWGKDGSTLLSWLPVTEVAELVRLCRAAGVRVALAGGLAKAEIIRLRDIEPDWFAVRGAVCRRGRRDQEIDFHAVQGLVGLLADHSSARRAEIQRLHC